MYKKTPLDYQITEYDCGTTTLLNALRFLFERKEISPFVIKHIMKETLDLTDDNGEECKGGTSVEAIEKIAEWIYKNGKKYGMNIKYKKYRKEKAIIDNKEIIETIKHGGIAIVRVYQDVDHYCLLTRINKNYAYLFDPYYLNIKKYDNDPEAEIIKDEPFRFNRKVSLRRLRDENKKDFSLVRGSNALIMTIERV